MDKLTPKQSMFVIEYLKDLNATQAAIRAGYSEDTARAIGCENLTKPNIAAAIDKQMEYRAQRTLITADYILTSMQEVAERCLQRKPVMKFNYDKKCLEQETTAVKNMETGEITEEGIWEFDSAGANKALENLARNQKLLTDRSELGNLDGSNFDIPNIIEVFVESSNDVKNAVKKAVEEKNNTTPELKIEENNAKSSDSVPTQVPSDSKGEETVQNS